MSRIEDFARSALFVATIAVAAIPVAIFGLIMLLFDRSPPFRHGPYNGHDSPYDI